MSTIINKPKAIKAKNFVQIIDLTKTNGEIKTSDEDLKKYLLKAELIAYKLSAIAGVLPKYCGAGNKITRRGRCFPSQPSLLKRTRHNPPLKIPPYTDNRPAQIRTGIFKAGKYLLTEGKAGRFG